MAGKLEGRRAIVVGGGGGIGGAIAHRFYAEGASIAVIDADAEAAANRAAELEAAATGDFTEAELATLRQLLGKLYTGLLSEAEEGPSRLAG